ncbi:helix-turn-helix domain-containing protein [Corallococcus sp. bb12-1]|uniref:helix-turn-helix domain-containing protein n=1 Tax=Corallococcus sp. bb12-1 TaxID=2996784 RepID=UPI002271A33C|nr:helix-turn-helix domain-containing protein [Corallococcus sp. bb12-1]MCY1041701.1 helix-turn-helix domain-containing protein [Corallococcus sp. bb12-1]
MYSLPLRCVVRAPGPRRELARTLGVSERHLRRAFDDVLGMGPKAFARLVRFQRALQASATPGAWLRSTRVA